MSKTKKVKIFKIIILIAVITLIVGLTIYLIPILKNLNTQEGQIQFKEKINDSKMLGFLILLGLQIAQMIIAILPGEPVEILAGICFGKLWGTIFLIASVFITTILIYTLVKKYGRKFIYEFFPKQKVEKKKNRNSYDFIIFSSRHTKRPSCIYRCSPTNKNKQIYSDSYITKNSIYNFIYYCRR